VIPGKSPLRRAAVVLTGGLLGLSGAFALAAPASAHHTAVVGKASCVDAAGNWTVDWTVSNSQANIEGKIATVHPTPQDASVGAITAGATLPSQGQPQLAATQKLGTDVEKVTLGVDVTWTYPNGDVKRDSATSDEVTRPVDCAAKPPADNKPQPPSSSEEPEFVVEQTCDELRVGVANPPTGKSEKVTFTPSVGSPKTITVKPGEVKTVTFPASDGLTVKAVPASAPDEAASIAWKKPDNCGGAGGGNELPKTGVAVGSIAGGAGALLAVGGGLFALARRRRIRFTV
jgi:LPXTG-motif cell wall-anchored protein